MLRKLRPRTIYDVMAAIGCFAALATGSAYAANTVFSTDIVDGEVKAPDIAGNAVDSARVRDNTLNTFDVHSFIGEDVIDGTLTGADIQNGSLNDEDVGEATVVDFVGQIGNVPANSCVDRTVTGVGGTGDHLVLTPDYRDTTSQLDYSVQHSAVTILGEPAVVIHVCNPTASARDDGNTRFNLLVIDAQ